MRRTGYLTPALGVLLACAALGCRGGEGSGAAPRVRGAGAKPAGPGALAIALEGPPRRGEPCAVTVRLRWPHDEERLAVTLLLPPGVELASGAPRQKLVVRAGEPVEIPYQIIVREERPVTITAQARGGDGAAALGREAYLKIDLSGEGAPKSPWRGARSASGDKVSDAPGG